MKKIEILGPGCAKCEKMYEAVSNVIKEMNLDCDLVKIKDIEVIMKYGVMMTPALVVDGVVKVFGKVPSNDEIKKYVL
ncbi:MAG: thioredoxin family protein [Candidatus Zixiibacteriota bacterium]